MFKTVIFTTRHLLLAPRTPIIAQLFVRGLAMSVRKTALCFTGGKDSTLTLHLLAQPLKEGIDEDLAARLAKCAGCKVEMLVTFIPAGQPPDFKAHPLDFMKLQSEALGIPLLTFETHSPYLESYRENIKKLRDEHNIQVLATGDMMDVSNGFMQKAVQGTDVELLTPLWEMERKKVLALVWAYEMKSLVTCINVTKFAPPPPKPASDSSADTTPDVPAEDTARRVPPRDDDAPFEPSTMLGQMLDRGLWEHVLVPCKDKFGVDECGELGEYHTMACDGSLFRRRLEVTFREEQSGVYRYLRITSSALVDK